MKIRNLAIIFTLGMLIASCTDKKAQDEIVKLKADMMAADSLCQADKAMMMDSLAKMQMMMDSIMNPPANSTSSSSKKSSSTTTTTTTTTTGDKSNSDRGGVQPVDKKNTDRGGVREEVKKENNKRGGN